MKTTHSLIQIISFTVVLAQLNTGCGPEGACTRQHKPGLVLADQTTVTPSNEDLSPNQRHADSDWIAIARLIETGGSAAWINPFQLANRDITDSSNGCIYQVLLNVDLNQLEARLNNLKKDLRDVDGDEGDLNDDLVTTALLEVRLAYYSPTVGCALSSSDSQTYTQSIRLSIDEIRDQTSYKKPGPDQKASDFTDYFLRAHFSTTLSPTVLGGLAFSSDIKLLVADDVIDEPLSDGCSSG